MQEALDGLVREGVSRPSWRNSWQRFAVDGGFQAPVWQLCRAAAAGEVSALELIREHLGGLESDRLQERFRAWLVPGSPEAGQRILWVLLGMLAGAQGRWDRAARGLAGLPPGEAGAPGEGPVADLEALAQAGCPVAVAADYQRHLREGGEGRAVSLDAQGLPRAAGIGVVGTDGPIGFEAWLQVELVAGGHGEFHPALSMLLLPLGPSFIEVLARARRCQVEPPAGWDFRWRLECDRQKLTALEGGSMGAATALALSSLLRDDPLPGRVFVTGSVSEDGRVEPVAAESLGAKAQAVRAAGAQLFLVPAGQAEAARAGTPGWEEVQAVASLEDARDLLHTRRLDRWWLDTSRELAQHPRLVGREALCERVRQASGYVLLVGGPGSGKSALVAELIRRDWETRRERPLFHFVRKGMGDWDEPEAIVRSLYAQLLSFRGLRDSALPGQSLTARLLAALEAVGGPEVVYLEGLDAAFGPLGRCPGQGLGSLLPARLPAGVTFVLTSRPGPHLEGLQALRIALDDHREDVEHMLLALPHLDPEVLREAARRSEGNFLYAHQVVRYLEGLEPAERTVQALPEGWEGLMPALWAEVRSQLPGPARAEQLLAAVALTREPLRLEDLRALLPAEVTERAEDVLALAAGILRDPGEGLRFAHRAMGEFFLRRVQTRTVHGWLGRACAGWEGHAGALRAYCLQYRLAHLAAGQDWEALGQALRDARYVEARLRHDPEKLAGVLADLAGVRVPPELERLRDFLALRCDVLSRHPESYGLELANELPEWAPSPFPAWRKLHGPPQGGTAGHAQPIRCLAFSADGRLAATGSEDRSVRLWDLGTGRPIRLFEGHPGPVQSLALSGDGALLAAGCGDGSLRLWEAGTGRLLSTLNGPHRQLTFGGHSLAGAGDDGQLYLWDPTGGLRELGLGPSIRDLAFSPDGTRLAVVRDRVEIRRIAQARSQPLESLADPHAVAWVGPELLAVAAGPEVVLFDLESGAGDSLVGEATLLAASDGRLAAAGRDQVRVWEGTRLVVERDCPRPLAISPDGRWLASTDGSSEARVVSVADGRVRAVLAGARTPREAAAVGPTYMASAGVQGVIHLDERTFKGPPQAITCLAAGRALLASAGQGVQVWDVQAELLLHQLCSGQKVTATALAGDDSLLAAARPDGSVELYEMPSGRPLSSLPPVPGPVLALAFSPCSRWLLAGGRDRVARLYQVSRSRPVHQLEGHGFALEAVAFAPHGGLLATGSADRCARLWERSSGQLLQILAGHTGAVKSVAFAPTGECLATGSWDRTVRLWSVADATCQAVLLFDYPVRQVAFRADGQLVVVDRTGRWFSYAEA